MNFTASMLALNNPISFSILVSTSVIFVSLTLISSLILPFSRLRSNRTPACVRLISSRSFCFRREMSPRRRSFSARRLMKSVRSESSRDCLRAEKSTCKGKWTNKRKADDESVSRYIVNYASSLPRKAGSRRRMVGSREANAPFADRDAVVGVGEEGGVSESTPWTTARYRDRRQCPAPLNSAYHRERKRRNAPCNAPLVTPIPLASSPCSLS